MISLGQVLSLAASSASVKSPIAHDGTRPQRLLAVSSEMPWPLDTGGHLRTFHLLQALATRFEVHLLTPSSTSDASAFEALRRAGIQAQGTNVKSSPPLRDAFKVVASRLRGQPYVMYARHDHAAMRDEVRRFCDRQHPAVLYLDHLDSLIYAGCCAGALKVLDLHNIYSLIADRAAESRGGLARWYLRGEAALLRAAEREASTRPDILFAVSDQERDYYQARGHRPVHLIPNGVDCKAYESLPEGRTGEPLILYLGSMSWPPNAEAALFLANDVLPVVRGRVPGARLRIVGRNPPAEVRSVAAGGIEVTGGVESVIPHLREAALLAVPLEAGGGTRLKILEALASGLPVVSTPIGAEGLDLTDGEHLLIAARDQFAESIVRLLNDRSFGTRLARNGRAAVTQRYDWTGIGQKAAAAIAAGLQSGSAQPSHSR
jgi:glycosyltransferase involved in cell wall biosynthesis